MTANYARTLGGVGAHEAVTILEKLAPTARRVLGGAHPVTEGIEDDLRYYRATLNAHKE